MLQSDRLLSVDCGDDLDVDVVLLRKCQHDRSGWAVLVPRGVDVDSAPLSQDSFSDSPPFRTCGLEPSCSSDSALRLLFVPEDANSVNTGRGDDFFHFDCSSSLGSLL